MTLISAAALADTLAANPGWVAFALFLLVFVEALIVVGYLVPAATVLFAVGALAGSGVVSFPLALAGTAAGATLGGSFNYWVGSRLQHRLDALWPFRQHPALLQRNRDFVRRHGGKSVFLARFSKPFRPTVSAVAGALGMDRRRFALFNLWGAILWSSAYLGVGFGLSHSVDFSPAQAMILSLILLAVTACGMLLLAVLRHRRLHPDDPERPD